MTLIEKTRLLMALCHRPVNIINTNACDKKYGTCLFIRAKFDMTCYAENVTV